MDEEGWRNPAASLIGYSSIIFPPNSVPSFIPTCPFHHFDGFPSLAILGCHVDKTCFSNRQSDRIPSRVHRQHLDTKTCSNCIEYKHVHWQDLKARWHLTCWAKATWQNSMNFDSDLSRTLCQSRSTKSVPLFRSPLRKANVPYTNLWSLEWRKQVSRDLRMPFSRGLTISMPSYMISIKIEHAGLEGKRFSNF